MPPYVCFDNGDLMIMSWTRRPLSVTAAAILLASALVASTLVARPAHAAVGIHFEPVENITVGWTGSPGKKVALNYTRSGAGLAELRPHIDVLKQWADVTFEGVTSCDRLFDLETRCFLPENGDGRHTVWMKIVPTTPGPTTVVSSSGTPSWAG